MVLKTHVCTYTYITEVAWWAYGLCITTALAFGIGAFVINKPLPTMLYL